MPPEQNNQVPPVNPNVEIDHDKLWSVLSYIPLFFILPLILVKNRSSFLNYHINQGIVLSLVVLIGYFGLSLLPWWMGFFFMIRWIWNILMIILLVIGIRNALEKRTEPLPVIGKFFNFLK
jgi:hypothetical protein